MGALNLEFVSQLKTLRRLTYCQCLLTQHIANEVHVVAGCFPALIHSLHSFRFPHTTVPATQLSLTCFRLKIISVGFTSLVLFVGCCSCLLVSVCASRFSLLQVNGYSEFSCKRLCMAMLFFTFCAEIVSGVVSLYTLIANHQLSGFWCR